MSNDHQFNSKIVISAGTFDKVLQLYAAVKEDIERRFGREAILWAGYNPKPAKNDYYYADILLSIPERS